MKNFKIAFAIMMVVGLMGITEAFACKSPATALAAYQASALVQKMPSVVLASFRDGDTRSFSRRDLVGRYSSYATATIFDPTANRTTSATCIGVVTFDGRGHFTDREVHSYDGVIVRDQFAGTYTVNPDGSGMMHYVGEAESYDQEIVLSNDGKDITFLILLDIPGIVSQGTMKKQ